MNNPVIVLEIVLLGILVSDNKLLETTNSTLPIGQIKTYYECATLTGGIQTESVFLKGELLLFDISVEVRDLSRNIIDCFIDNEIELPDMSDSHEGSVIFEFADYELHYAIEVFESGLISYFINKGSGDEFYNFHDLEQFKAKLIEDCGIQQVQ